MATCVRAGAGGRDSAAKAEWLVGATEQWMTENQNVEPEELADFYQEVLWNEFDTVVDDGSLSESEWHRLEYLHRSLCQSVRFSIRLHPSWKFKLALLLA